MLYLFNIELGIGSSSEDVFTALRSFSIVVVDGNVKEEREYRGRLYGSLSGVGSDLIILMTLVLKYWSNVSISVVMGSFGRTRSDILYIYGSETCETRQKEFNSLLVFEMKCLRAILRVTRSDRLSNIAIRKTLNVVETIEEVIVKRLLVRSCSKKSRYD